MKMQNVDIEIIEFDTLDVIATSGGGDVDDSTVQVIWMTPESIFNFNNIYDNDADLYYDDEAIDSIAWISYGGAFFEYKQFGIKSWTQAGGHILKGQPDPTEGIRTVREGNVDDYNGVFNWLRSKGNYPY